MKKRIAVVLLLLCFFACDKGGGDDKEGAIDNPPGGNVTLSDTINSEAEELGNFPEDAEVAEMESLTVNGENLEGEESQQLEDTDKEAIDAEVTLPASLSRGRNVSFPDISLWLNGEIIDFEMLVVSGPIAFTVNLKVGANYFFLIITDTEGNKYRTIVMKITRIEVQTPNPVVTEINEKPGDIYNISVDIGAAPSSFKMIQSNNRSSLVFPKVSAEGIDELTATLSQEYSIGETEVTAEVFAKVYQWAYDNGKFNEASPSAHNYIDPDCAMWGKQELIYYDADNQPDHFVNFDTSSNSFNYDNNYANYPVDYVTWYGAVMFCNWLTEIIDGNTDQLAYSGIDEDWNDDETIVDMTKTGFRLPSANEWECAARWVGQSAGTRTDLISAGVNNGSAELTEGFYWTPYDYVSGCTKPYTDAIESVLYAWNDFYFYQAAQKEHNQLGIYDMSGNIDEWCFSEGSLITTYRTLSGGSSMTDFVGQRIGVPRGLAPTTSNQEIGFRIARTEK